MRLDVDRADHELAQDLDSLNRCRWRESSHTQMIPWFVWASAERFRSLLTSAEPRTARVVAAAARNTRGEALPPRGVAEHPPGPESAAPRKRNHKPRSLGIRPKQVDYQRIGIGAGAQDLDSLVADID